MKDTLYNNGCNLSSEIWEKQESQLNYVTDRLDEIHDLTKAIEEDRMHLKSIADASLATSVTLVEIKNSLLNTILGKDIVPFSIVRGLIEEQRGLVEAQRKAYTNIIKALLWIFGVIILVVIGLKALVPTTFFQ